MDCRIAVGNYLVRQNLKFLCMYMFYDPEKADESEKEKRTLLPPPRRNF